MCFSKILPEFDCIFKVSHQQLTEHSYKDQWGLEVFVESLSPLPSYFAICFGEEDVFYMHLPVPMEAKYLHWGLLSRSTWETSEMLD